MSGAVENIPGFYETNSLRSWGRTLASWHVAARPAWRDEAVSALSAGAAHANGVLAIGLGRSYGDTGLNPDGAAIVMAGVDRLLAFDPATGIVRAEAGMALAALLAFLLPRGFFLPVTPGSQYVTLGGAVANDVHGKNHHGAGTFGAWVRAIGLVRSDGTEHVLRAEDPTNLFAATIGGLGLTGLITWVEFEALPVGSDQMEVETLPFDALPEFFALSQESDKTWPYTVSWIDCFAQGGIGRGLLSRGRHAAVGHGPVRAARRRLSVPMAAPDFLLGEPVIRTFNALYYAAGKRQASRRGGQPAKLGYEKFFYPLDVVQQWNLLYGERGMYQYQSVVPPDVALPATSEMLRQIAKSGEGSFLAVLKTFGPKTSPGLLSFPREGTTLALDFPNRGASTMALLARLDDVVREAGGRLYPAKDGRMPPAMFAQGYPNVANFSALTDPKFSSAFWRRMRG